MGRPKKNSVGVDGDGGDAGARETGKKEESPKNPGVSTRVPSRLHAYMKSLFPMRGFRSFNAMKAALVAAFLAEQPWSRHGISWRATRSQHGKDPDAPKGSSGTGWEQENFYISQDLKDRMYAVLISEDISQSSFLYTACFWWCWYIHPPEIEVRRRRQEGLPERAELTPAAATAMAMAATKRAPGVGRKK